MGAPAPGPVSDADAMAVVESGRTAGKPPVAALQVHSLVQSLVFLSTALPIALNREC